MIYNILNVNQFIEIISTPIKKAIIFTTPNCNFCKFFLKKLNECYYKQTFYNMEITDDNRQRLIENNVKMRLFYPYTRIYEKGLVIDEFMGELFDTQIQELISKLEN